MVSGFFTSPCDHSRIFSGDASEMRIAENDSGSFGFSKKLKMSFILPLCWCGPLGLKLFEFVYSPPSSAALGLFAAELAGAGGRRRGSRRRRGAGLGGHLARH